MSSIYHVFMIIAPISPLLVGIFFLLAYPLYAHLLINILGPPMVDTAGEVWVQAVTYQTAGLATSQVLLLGVTVFKASPSASVLVVIALIATTFRASQIQKKYVCAAAAAP